MRFPGSAVRHLGIAGLLIASFWIFAAPTPAHAQEGPRFATVQAGKANIYAEPNEAAPVKLKVKRGTFLEVGGVRGMWVKVRTSDGVIGYVLKTDVVPGKKELGGGGGGGGGGSIDGGGGGGGHVGHVGGVGSGEAMENRKGILTKVGLAFAGNSYKISGSPSFSRNIPMKTGYTGIDAQLDYFFIPAFGAHVRFMDTFGSMTATLGAPVNKRVDRIPTNVTRIEADLVGRFFFGDDPASASINGRLGFHIHQMLVDPVQTKSGTPLFLVSQKYQGLIVGFGTDIPLGSPSFGLRAGADFWLNPSLSEGVSNASGKAKSASGLDFGAGTYFNFSDTAGMDIGLEYDSFSASFSGTGNRFNTQITNAKSADSYILFGIDGTFRF